MYTVNSAEKENVTETNVTDYRFEEGIFSTVMKPASWNVIVLGKK
jgi:alpha-L-arabinofuranosidase